MERFENIHPFYFCRAIWGFSCIWLMRSHVGSRGRHGGSMGAARGSLKVPWRAVWSPWGTHVEPWGPGHGVPMAGPWWTTRVPWGSHRAPEFPATPKALIYRRFYTVFLLLQKSAWGTLMSHSVSKDSHGDVHGSLMWGHEGSMRGNGGSTGGFLGPWGTRG